MFVKPVTGLMKQLAMNCLALACTLLPLSNAAAEIFDLGGMRVLVALEAAQLGAALQVP